MKPEPYRIFWDDELWLARRLREASADPAGEDRRQTASGKKDSGISRITDRKSPNGESRVPQPFAGTEVPGEKRLPAAISPPNRSRNGNGFQPRRSRNEAFRIRTGDGGLRTCDRTVSGNPETGRSDPSAKRVGIRIAKRNVTVPATKRERR